MVSPQTNTPRVRWKVTSVGAATWTIAIFTAVAAVVSLLVWLGLGPNSAVSDGPHANTTAGPAGSPVSRGSPIDAPAAAVRYLDEMSAVVGQANRVPVPERLASDPGYARAIAVACPSNETGHQHTEITYELRKNFASFSTTILPHRDPAEMVRVEVAFYRDAIDLLPGAPPPGEQSEVQMRMGERRDYTLDVSDAYKLRLRIKCELPGGMVIFAGARLTAKSTG